MNQRKRIVIVGATSAIAEACAKHWVGKQASDLTLVGRDKHRLIRVANDLNVRSPQSEIRIIEAEFLDPDAIDATTKSITQLGDVDIVLIAHGTLPVQTECQENLTECRKALEVNGISAVLYAESFASQMIKANKGTIGVISSVAGERGRKSNYVYGAAKAMVTRYVEGLQHRFAGTGVKAILIKPGPTDTPMTTHLKGRGSRLARVENVASDIVNGIEMGRPIIYTPRKWQIIMAIVRNIPSVLFNKMDI